MSSPRAWLACTALVMATAPIAAADRPGALARVVHAGDNPSLGPRDALVTIELYFVPGTDEGHAAYTTLVALAARHPTRLRAIFRPRQIGARHAVAALALAAHRQGAFFRLMDALAATSPPLAAGASYDLAAQLGLDREALGRADRDPALLRILADNQRRGFLAPTTEMTELVINGQPTSTAPVRVNAGSTTVAALESLYAGALAEAKLAAAQGIAPGTLPRWNRWQTWCTDNEPAPQLAPSAWLTPGTTAPPPPIVDDGPRFAWHLGGLIDRGTGCPPPDHRPSMLDGLAAMSEPVSDRPTLLAAPLPLAGAPAFGPPDAAVPVVVVCDPRGDACRSQLGLLRPLVELYQGRVRLVWLPLGPSGYDLDGGEDETALAQLALCAASLGDGWPFSSDPSGVSRGAPSGEALARVAGADPAAVLACADADRGPARRLIAAVQDTGLQWGPTVVIGGRGYLGGFIDARAAAAAVERELAPGLLEQLAPRRQ